MDPDAPDDPLAPIEKEILRLVLARIQMRAHMALKRDLRELEARVGHALPTVRAQLDHLVALPELPALSSGATNREAGGESPSPEDGLHSRKRGRPKKQRDADEFDAPGTELS